jgi:hypothetical protein
MIQAADLVVEWEKQKAVGTAEQMAVMTAD